MSLIKLTTNQRNGKAYAKEVLINLDNIAQPVIENSSNEVIVVLDESTSLRGKVSQGSNNVQYIFDEDIAAFVALAPAEIFIGTVISRDERNPVVTSQAFIVSNIVGLIKETPSGSEFLYDEDGGSVPVKYVVSETIADIDTALA